MERSRRRRGCLVDIPSVAAPRGASSDAAKIVEDGRRLAELRRAQVRVLNVKQPGNVTIVRVPVNGTAADLKEAVAAAFDDAPPSRQRLIAGGRPVADGPLSDVGVVPKAPPPVVHLAVRPADAPAPADAAEAPAPSVETYDVAALLRAAATMPREEPGAAAARARTFRAAARVRLLSSLLSLYCAASALGILLDAAAPDGRHAELAPLGLFINGLGVWVGGAGMAAARRMDAASVHRYDRGLRLLAVCSMAYESYVSLYGGRAEIVSSGRRALQEDGMSMPTPRKSSKTVSRVSSPSGTSSPTRRTTSRPGTRRRRTSRPPFSTATAPRRPRRRRAASGPRRRSLASRWCCRASSPSCSGRRSG